MALNSAFQEYYTTPAGTFSPFERARAGVRSGYISLYRYLLARKIQRYMHVRDIQLPLPADSQRILAAEGNLSGTLSLYERSLDNSEI